MFAPKAFARLALAGIMFSTQFAFADLPNVLMDGPVAAGEVRDRISQEIARIDQATARLKDLRNKKAMTGRGWTSLDDIVVGGATLVSAGSMYGLMSVLPRYATRVRFLRPEFLATAKFLSAIVAGVGALQLAQGAVIYPFVPHGEMGVSQDQNGIGAVAAERVDLGSLSQEQAEALLARLQATRAELEESADNLTHRLAPKLESRLAFIASTMVSASWALVGIGAGIYVVGGQAGRAGPLLMRVKQLESVGQFLAEHGHAIKIFSASQGIAIGIQGVIGLGAGVLTKMFVPKNTKAASPVQ